MRSTLIPAEGPVVGARIRVMIIVTGVLYVDEEGGRDRYLSACAEVVAAARKAEGCIDFSLAPDLIEPGRINVYEQWESAESVDAFRGSGPSSEQAAAIRDARVFQFEVTSATRL